MQEYITCQQSEIIVVSSIIHSLITARRVVALWFLIRTILSTKHPLTFNSMTPMILLTSKFGFINLDDETISTQIVLLITIISYVTSSQWMTSQCYPFYLLVLDCSWITGNLQFIDHKLTNPQIVSNKRWDLQKNILCRRKSYK